MAPAEEEKHVLGCTCNLAPPFDVPNKYLSKPHIEAFLRGLNSLRKNVVFCDVQLVSKGYCINAHKAILAASSPYFYAMFTNGLLEADKKSIELPSVSPDVLEILINFIYSGEINIYQENVEELMIAADMLELNDAVNCCTEFLKSEIDSSNAIGLLRFADMHNFTVLHKLSEDFIYGNFVQICEEDELGDLSKDQFIKFLNSEYLCVDSEQQVFRAAMKWIKHDLADRRRYIFEILSCIRIPLMSIQILEREVNENTDASLRVALRSIYTDIAERIGNLVALQVEPRLGAKKDIYILGGSKREICSAWSRYSESTFESVVKFNTFRKEWCDIKPMNIGRIMPGVAILNGCIYVVGGENESLILSNGECYNPIEDKWTPVAGMTVPRCEFGMAALNGYLYAIGGWVGDDIGGSIEIYSPSLNRWTMCNSVLPEPRFSMGVVSFEGLIYIVGGCTRTKRHLQDLLSYNPVTGEWSILAPMLVPRSQMGVAVLDKHLYVVGGITSNNEVLNLVEQYDFEENTWSFVTPMKGKRASPAVAAADGMLYVIGGDITHTINSYRSQITISSVERYNNSTSQWEDLPSLPESRSEAGVAVL